MRAFVQKINNKQAPALCAVATLLVLAGCRAPTTQAPLPGDNLPVMRPEEKPAVDVRRLLFAQVVEDNESEQYRESAILEGKVYKYFLKCVAATNHDRMRKQTDEQVTYEALMSQPGLFRGQVVTLNRGVIVEVAEAKLPPEYALPNYKVLVAVFVDAAREVYPVRILCPLNSKLYEKLNKGIEDDAYPVMRLTGYFMKLYARRVSRPDEAPWRRPLLICPEPEFSQIVEPRHLAVDIEATKLLPSERIQAKGAEERLVIEMLPGGKGLNTAIIKVGEMVADRDLNNFIAEEVAALRNRLADDDQKANPSAVILIKRRAPRDRLKDVVSALRTAGVKRLFIKRED